jgi:uncharacterized protein DUF664
MLEVSVADYLWFVHLALDQMVAIVRQLGDVGANRCPTVAQANTPFAILTHCLGVMEFWGGAMVAERPVVRERAAEFTARGDVEGLVERTEAALGQLHRDLGEFSSSACPPYPRGSGDEGEPYRATKGAVLLHILEELLQHLGQMELTRDVLLAAQPDRTS